MTKLFPGSDKLLAPVNATAPDSIKRAIQLMYGGAALMAVSFVVSLIGLSGVKTAIHNANHKLTPSQVNSVFDYLVVSTVILGLIGVGLWLLMARGAGRGRRWAQVASTILFALYTLESVLTFAQTTEPVTLVFTLLVWAVGAACTYMLWRPDSKAWFLAG
jgi:predicted membrane channel-forming protein YqfA (hemolysin III family)